MLGLRNYGNNCYFNSVIQAISSSKYFCLNFRNTEIEGDNIIKDIQEVINKKWSNINSQTSYNTMKIHSRIIKYSNTFAVGRQEDAAELLTYLLDMIDETKMDNLIELYKNKYSYTKICSSCKTISKNNTSDNVLRVDINPDARTLMDCIRTLIRTETISYHCEDCDHQKNFLRKIFLKDYVFPKVLFIELKRYTMMRKNKQEIGFSCVINLNGTRYNLKAIVVHLGERNGGHYITYARFKDDWILYNDDYCKIFKTNELPIQIMYQNAYLFVYDRED